MTFQKSSLDGVSVIAVKYTHATSKESGEFKKIINDEISKGSRQIIIDMAECEYIDSTFLGVLLAALKKTSTTGGDIRLVGFKPSAQSILDITGTARVFKIYSSLKQALSSFLPAA